MKIRNYAILVTQQMDIMAQCIRLLQEYGKIEPELTLRQAYDKYVSPDVLPMNDDKLWDAVDNTDILALFQLVSDVGSQTVKKLHPRNIQTLNDCNGIMRLMADDSGETPTDRYVRIMYNPQQWQDEMDSYGLTKEEQSVIKEYVNNGVLIDQESLMRIVMDKRICGFSLKESNQARKVVAKKHMDEIPALRQKILNRATSPAMGEYVWFLLQPSMGYSFSSIHGTSYSYIAVQAAYLATYFPSIYWNTAYLRVISGLEEDDSTNYVKTAAGVGEVVAHNISVRPIDINRSNYMFEPDEKHNAILYGLKALNGVGGEVIDTIIKNRPYSSLQDFLDKTKVNKTVTLSLIRSGAFDEFGDRVDIMKEYLRQVSEPKKKLTMQNFKGLMDFNLLPQNLDFQKRLFVFNKALRANCKKGAYFAVENNYYDFYSKFFDVDELEPIDSTVGISQKKWQKMYTKAMEPAKKYIADNQDSLLEAYNSVLFQEQWNKYAQGNVSAWEMDSMGYYYHEHELAHVRQEWYDIKSYKNLSEEPPVTYTFKRNGREIPVFDTCRIMGTVIGKNNTKATVNLLTRDSGVVTVKFMLDDFAFYNRRITENIDGVNKQVEAGWFSKGTLLVVNGYRRGDIFRAKKYRKSESEMLYRITNVDNERGTMIMTHLRYGQKE